MRPVKCSFSYRQLKSKEPPPAHRLHVWTACSLNHVAWIELQGLVFEGPREVNQEKSLKCLRRPKHSQKYAKPDPQDKQSNAKTA